MIGGILMSDTRRYGKPSMTDLPGELGKSVMETIMNAPKPDRRKMQEESDRMVSIILAERAREKTRNSQ